MSAPSFFGDLPSLARRVAGDLRTWPVQGPRLIDEIECVCSVLLAIAFAHLLEVRHVGWAAFSGYMVMRSDVWRSFKRGGLRVLGTAAGSALAWAFAAQWLQTPLHASLALLAVCGVSLYFMMISPRGYAWLFLGLTFSMVVIDGLAHPEEPLAVFAWTRFVEVAAGTTASVIVSAVSTLTARRLLLGQRGFSMDYEWWVDRLIPWHGQAFVHALQGAVAIALIPWLWAATGLSALTQASTTIMVVMAIPLAGLAHNRTRTKLVHRFVGCTLGALLAGAALLVGQHSVVFLLASVAVAVTLGRHIENGKHGIDYVGTQFVLGFLTVMVPDTYESLHLATGIERLIGVLAGIALLEPVRLLLRLPARGASSEVRRDSAGD
ncbi:MAG: FUSC family protein [Candidatus Dactylopiibacterium sp.]|nr:FUSC family protein [Candidatus Dactylopiibacterium sp.]